MEYFLDGFAYGFGLVFDYWYISIPLVAIYMIAVKKGEEIQRNEKIKVCKHCAEEIKKDALVCRYCHNEV